MEGVVMDVVTYALTKKLTEFPLINEIENGDFSNGYIGWAISTGGTLSVACNTLYVTGNGGAASVTSFQHITTPFEVGKKYYMKCKMRVTNSLCTRVAIVVHLPDKTHLVVAQGSPMENNWYDLSGILEGTINGKSEIRLNHLYNTATDANGAVMECQYVLAINLTETFGVGNEPTAEEMDELLSCFPESWFDGKQNLPGKWVMTYLLNQVRDIKTAVVGLGGTV
jgi:hypothetical protein